MKRKGKESKLNVALTVLLVTFVWLLSFSIGVISGKGWSDRDYKVRSIEADNHLKQAMNEPTSTGEDITDKEVELLTQKALEEARHSEVEAPTSQFSETQSPAQDTVAKSKPENDLNKMTNDVSTPKISQTDKPLLANKETVEKRTPSSLPPKPTTPKPTSIEYTVQVASYKSMEEAEVHSQKLIDKGFPAFPVKAQVNKQMWYRVSVGSFKNRKQAIRYQSDLKKQAMVKNSIVQKVSRK